MKKSELKHLSRRAILGCLTSLRYIVTHNRKQKKSEKSRGDALLFPLRFGRSMGEGLLADVEIDLQRATKTNPEEGETLRFRRRALDGDRLPPLLPDPEKGAEGWLLADRLLSEGLLANLLCWQAGLDETRRHQVRLASLVYPFIAQLTTVLDAIDAEAGQFAHYWATGEGAPSEDVRTVIEGVHQTSSLQVCPGQLIIVAAQRIKQYVFDSSFR